MSSETRQRRVSRFAGEPLSTPTKYKVVESPRVVPELRFRHWLGIIVGVALIYAVVVYLDRRMPDVLPANDRSGFSEERARYFLGNLTALGPRVSGSLALEVDAVNIVSEQIKIMQERFERNGVNRLVLDIQRPSGCYNLAFLTPFTLCYNKITNIVVRIGPRVPSRHAILLNCHLDTLPDTPGATDDAVSCAINLEILDVLSRRSTPLENDIIFLFNGAEENFLQASHGFITQHRWRHDVRAFINLEGAGSGGREILFQAGPGESWILKTYLDNAPYPHCSAVAQEIFQLGIVPSDTDYRIFRDFGGLSGLDIAYHRNGWIYHTEFDTADVIGRGAIQRAGENVLAVTQALVRSPYLTKPSKFDEGNKWVFYDVVGLFTVRYKLFYATILNYGVIGGVLLLVFFHFVVHNAYHEMSLLDAFGHHLAAFVVMALTGLCVVVVVHFFNLTMCWYSLPELVFPLYIVPMLIAGCWTHSRFALKMRGSLTRPNLSYKSLHAELVHYDAVLIFWSAILFIMTASGLASSFFILFHVLFPALRDPILSIYIRTTKRALTPWVVFIVQWICLMPVVTFICYAVMLFFEFFVPVMGRFGNVVSPEWLMMPLSLMTAASFVLFTSNLIYLSRPMNYFFKGAVAFFVLSFLLIGTTRLGNPYKWSDDGLPRLRRLIILHAKRTIFNYDGSVSSLNNGLFIQSFDYRGVGDLPEHTFLQGSDKPNCSGTPDAYCQLPYYTAIFDLLPPEASRWVPLPNPPFLSIPLWVELISREPTSDNKVVNITFSVSGGVDKMSLHITPINGYELKDFSFTKFDKDILGKRQTYFVFLSYGYVRPTVRQFWILLETNTTRADALELEPKVEIVAATHQAHGIYQNSPTLHQLRSLIKTRRKTPHLAVGYWKWGITPIAGTAELVSRLF